MKTKFATTSATATIYKYQRDAIRCHTDLLIELEIERFWFKNKKSAPTQQQLKKKGKTTRRKKRAAKIDMFVLIKKEKVIASIDSINCMHFVWAHDSNVESNDVDFFSRIINEQNSSNFLHLQCAQTLSHLFDDMM